MTKRLYDQYCPLALALDIVGERWAMLVIRELLSGPKRFADLEAGLPGIGTATLTTRLEGLETSGVIARRRLPAPSAATAYELTDWGRGLEPIVYAVARWGAPLLGSATPQHALRATWLAVALQALFHRAAVRHLTASVELVVPTGTLTLHFSRGNLRVVDGPGEAPTARIVTTEQKFLEFLSGRAGRSARNRRDLRVEGDESLLDRLVEAFPLAADSAG